MHLVLRLASWVVLAGCASILMAECLAVGDIDAFEWAPLFELFGWRGLVVVALLNAGVVSLGYRAARCALRLPVRAAVQTNTLIATGAIVAVALLQYMFIEWPPSVRMLVKIQEPVELLRDSAESSDFHQFSLTTRTRNAGSADSIRVMYERIRSNNPATYEVHPLGATIDRYATRYGIDPTFLFFRAYINSFYGEALAGRVPLFRAMTAETIRDVVQVHLPAWFVESRARQWFVTSDVFPRLAGQQFGFKLRYAVHKSNLDVSTQPYDVSTYSDVFMVMQRYPEEFSDVLAAAEDDALRWAVRRSFEALRSSAIIPPCEEPYRNRAYDDAYYNEHRIQLKSFARGAYYLTVLDFSFATRVQALLSRYQTALYVRTLGEQRWNLLPDWQRLVMLAMVRDLYTPNVGEPSYNVYALPELNCTPVAFVSDQAMQAPLSVLGPEMTTVWKPSHSEFLWGGAGYQLRVLNEVWSAVNANPIPDIGFEDTLAVSRKVLAVVGP